MILETFFVSYGMTALWFILAVALAVVEVMTVALVSIWFVAGAVVAMLCSLLGLPIWIQVLVFIIISTILLASTRKIVMDKLKVGSKKTNKDELIGKIAVVIVDIKPHEGGRVKVDGLDWMAKFEDNSLFLEKGNEVVIERIEGVKLIVVPKN